MSNLLLTDETFAAKMAEKKAMLDNIASQLNGIVSPYTYMTSDEYKNTTLDPSKLYWVLADDGAHGVYKNGILCEGENVLLSLWVRLQNQVRAGIFSKNHSVGDQLIVKYNGNDTIWDIVAIDVATPADTSKTHSVTLMPHYLLPDYMMFDNKEPNNTDSGRKSYGNNRYKDSNIRLWLNSDGAAGSWWTAQHDADAAPSYATTKAGFMNGFDANFLDVIGETKIKVVKNTVTDGGSYEELVDKFYLPSITEVGLGNENNIAEGALFPYFDSATKRAKSISGGSAYYWWLRTPYSGSSYRVRSVNSSGSLSTYDAYYTYGVAPACNII